MCPALVPAGVWSQKILAAGHVTSGRCSHRGHGGSGTKSKPGLPSCRALCAGRSELFAHCGRSKSCHSPRPGAIFKGSFCLTGGNRSSMAPWHQGVKGMLFMWVDEGVLGSNPRGCALFPSIPAPPNCFSFFLLSRRKNLIRHVSCGAY